MPKRFFLIQIKISCLIWRNLNFCPKLTLWKHGNLGIMMLNMPCVCQIYQMQFQVLSNYQHPASHRFEIQTTCHFCQLLACNTHTLSSRSKIKFWMLITFNITSSEKSKHLKGGLDPPVSDKKSWLPFHRSVGSPVSDEKSSLPFHRSVGSPREWRLIVWSSVCRPALA